MSKRWRVAGFVIAAITFVATLVDPIPGRDDVLAGLPPVLRALIYAISAFVLVWLCEGIYLVVLRIGHVILPARPQTGERR
jgi:hypothetical protein